MRFIYKLLICLFLSVFCINIWADSILAGPYSTLDEGLNAYVSDTGGGVFHRTNSSPDGQCVWFCRAVRPDTIPSTSPSGYAKDIWNNSGSWHRGSTPKPGAVMCFNASTRYPIYGHVAIVASVNSDGSVDIWESNYFSLKISKRRVTDFSGLQGYLYAVDSDCPPTVWKNANVWWTSIPTEGRWYRSNERLSYSYSGSNVNIEENPHVGGYDAMYLAEAGRGWRTYTAHAWNDCGNVTIGWTGGWDDLAPVVSWRGDCPPRQTWLRGNPEATFAWNDENSGVKGDVNTTYCRWNGGQKLAEYDGTVSIPEGKNTLEVRCEDEAWDGGNRSGNATTISGEFWLDNTPPTVSSPTLSVTSPSNAGTIPVTVSASDPNGSNGSGISTIIVKVDGTEVGRVNAASGSVNWNTTTYSEGSHSITATAVDVAGNTSDVSPAVSCVIDRTAPITQITINGTQGETPWYTSFAQVTLSSSDPSGYVTKYKLNNETETEYSSPFSVSDGKNTLKYYSYDLTSPVPGNVETEQSADIWVDTTPPSIPVVTDEGADTGVDDSITFTFMGEDSVSGLLSYRYAVIEDPNITDEAIGDEWQTNPIPSGDAPWSVIVPASLVANTPVYVRVKTMNQAGLESAAGQTDGITYYPTLARMRIVSGTWSSSASEGLLMASGGYLQGTLGEGIVTSADGNTNNQPGDLVGDPNDENADLWGGYQQTIITSSVTGNLKSDGGWNCDYSNRPFTAMVIENNQVIETVYGITSANNQFTINPYAKGTYDICVKLVGALSFKLTNVMLTGANVVVGEKIILTPDIMEDDTWDDFELNEINGGFGDPITPGTKADFNCDGIYDDFDLNQIVGGFGTSGECFGLM